MAAISAVLFDFGKVLSGPPSPSAWAAMIDLLQAEPKAFEEAYWSRRDDYDEGVLSGEQYWIDVAQRFGMPTTPLQIARLCALDIDLWTEMNEPMIAWVHRLHEAGVRTGILSNIGDAMESGVRARFDWVGRFHHAVWSHRLRMRKPDPAIYEAAAQGLGVPPSAVLFIDDKAENIRGAEQVGMTGMLYESHPQFEAEMQQRGFAWLLHPERAEEATRSASPAAEA